MLFSFFAVLYVGVFLLLTTGRIGLFGLCIFMRAFNLGGIGCFSKRCFIWFLVKTRLFFCSVSRIVLQSLFSGFFGVECMLYSNHSKD
jgi:hypothetical protein